MHCIVRISVLFLVVGEARSVVGGLIAAVVATAAPEFNTRGNRFKPLAYTELTPEQRAFADKEIAGGRKPETGPFNIYLRSSEMACHPTDCDESGIPCPLDRANARSGHAGARPVAIPNSFITEELSR